ncbi:MAG TPA: response regulator, partial [Vicinamibacteria bacterium]|nr:response regulator [Vicinamibacteria bacterium]
EELERPQLSAIVVTGMVSRLDELRARAGPGTQFAAKPIEPARLLELVAGQLTAAAQGAARGRRVLVVDDEPANRKLLAFRLKHAGYDVDVAPTAAEALDLARRRPPDAIVSDILMPGMDGFGLSRSVRQEARLSATPIVLVSSAYVDEADRELAGMVGANVLVVRTPDLGDVLRCLEAALAGALPAPPAADDVGELHERRLQVQLERQTARNEALLRQTAIQATALSIIRGLSEVLAQPADVADILGDVLVHCLDAAGLSTGLLYVQQQGAQRVQAQFGLSAQGRAEAEGCFGHPELVERVLQGRQPLALSAASAAGDPEASDFLRRLGLSSALLVPFVVLGESYGELVLASDAHDLSEPAWTGFARSLSLQFGQTVALGQSLKRMV